MAVVLRMTRLGRRNRPFYRIVATEKRNPRDGKSLETLGYFDPFANDPEKTFKIDTERAQYWIDQGARPSQAVSNFFRKVDVKWGEKPTKNRRSLARKRRRAAAK